jgi:Uma2 family endonuclease
VRSARRLHYRYEDYLAALEVSGVRLEYCEGEIYAMAGGTPAHADLAAAAIRPLGNALVGRCRVSSSDLKVRIEATDLRGEKLSHYQQCSSVQAVLFVSHRRPHVTVVARTPSGWEAREYRAGQKVAVTEPL